MYGILSVCNERPSYTEQPVREKGMVEALRLSSVTASLEHFWETKT